MTFTPQFRNCWTQANVFLPYFLLVPSPRAVLFQTMSSGGWFQYTPDVAYVDPRFLEEGSGTSGDDHPHSDIRVGQHFLSSIYRAVTQSPATSISRSSHFRVVDAGSEAGLSAAILPPSVSATEIVGNPVMAD